MTNKTPTLAELLSQARTQRGYSREQLAVVTRVPLTFIVAIEEEDNTALPETVFCRGFLHIIARQLELELPSLLAAFAELRTTPAELNPLPSTSDVLSRTEQRKATTRQRAKPLLLTMLALALLGGLAFYFLQQRTTNTPVPHLADHQPSTAVPPVATPPTMPAPVRQRLRLQVLRPLQIEVVIDAGEREQHLLLPQSYEFEFEQQARVVISDTSAVKLWLNGETIAALQHRERQRVYVFKASTLARAEDNAGHHFQH